MIGIRTRLGILIISTQNENTKLTSTQEIGVDVLEMDTVFTKDGVPVIWHDVSLLHQSYMDLV